MLRSHARHPNMVLEHFGPIMQHPLGPHPLEKMPPIELLEQILACQYEELQILEMDNLRLGSKHVSLREEFVGTQ
jgi:hypothetical protein